MDLLWMLVYSGAAFIETYVVFNLFNAKYELKRSKGTKDICMVIIIAIMVIRNTVEVDFISENIFMIAIGVIIYIGINFVYKGSKIEHLIIICVATIVISIADFIGIGIIIKVFNVDISQVMQATNIRIAAIVLSKTLTIVGFDIFIKVKIDKESIMVSNYRLEYMIIVITNIIGVFVITAYFNSSGYIANGYSWLQNMLVFVIVITNIGIVLIYNRIIKQTRKEMEYRLALQAQEYQDSYKKNIEETAEILSRNKHDFHNHMLALKGLLEKNKALEVSDYMEDLIMNMEDNTKNIVITNNAVVDAILTFKKDMAKKQDIDFTERVNIQNLNVSDVDMTVILGNILDNAIEASIKEPKEKRFIDLDISEEKGYIRIKCKNNYDGNINKEEEVIKTSKMDKTNHGYGLGNIEIISKKYDGYIKTEIGEDFSIIVYIKNVKIKAYAL